MSCTSRRIAPTIDLTTNPRRHRKDVAARWMFRAGAWATFLVTVLIIVTLVVDAWDFVSKLADDDGGLGALCRTSDGSHGAACSTSARSWSAR